ncbi:MAG: hypothetical protein ABEI06_07815 [Halobacteriaceae archaeon]
MESTTVTDKEIGLTILFTALAIISALFVFIAPTQGISAIGFMTAIVFGIFAIIVLHIY